MDSKGILKLSEEQLYKLLEKNSIKSSNFKIVQINVVVTMDNQGNINELITPNMRDIFGIHFEAEFSNHFNYEVE